MHALKTIGPQIESERTIAASLDWVSNSRQAPLLHRLHAEAKYTQEVW